MPASLNSWRYAQGAQVSAAQLVYWDGPGSIPGAGAMSDTKISIGELTGLREGWPESIAPVLDPHGEWHGKFDHSDNEHVDEGYIECDSWDTDNAELFAKLIAAEHNALPVLLEIAKAALAERIAVCDPRVVPDCSPMHMAPHCPIRTARERVDAVLGKVQL